MKKSNAMWPISYNITTLVGMLLFVFLATPSFGSDVTQQDAEIQKQPLTKRPFISTSSAVQLPHDVRVYILSFLPDQKDLLRMGAVSKSWRNAAQKVWEKRWLDLSNKHLTEADYQALARGIFSRLKLNKVALDEEAIKILATGSHLQALELLGNTLRATESLIKLFSLSHLSHIDLGENSIGDEGAKAIAGALKQNAALTTIELDNNTIGIEGVKAIVGALKQNTVLTALGLAGNSISTEGAKALAGMLAQNTTLTAISLDGTRIGDEGAKAIAGALKQNRALTYVNLDWNNMGAEGAKAIAAALKDNKTLTRVDLHFNSVGDEGAKAIAEAIKENKALTWIGLYNNQITDRGVKTIIAALKDNKTLTTIALGSNTISNEIRKALEDLKRSRPSLKLYY